LRWPMNRRALLAAGVLLIPALLLAEFRRPLNSDSAWLLYVARRVVQGDRLYIDLIEINPPLIVWLQVPVVTLARAVGSSPATTLRLFVLAWVSLSLLLSALALKRTLPGKQARDFLLLVQALVLLAWTRTHFAEREHLALAAVLPYFFLIASTLPPGVHHLAVRIAIGVFAAMGLALKPHFIVVWIACLGLSLTSRPRRSALPLEDLVILGTLLLYGCWVLLGAPEYLELVRLLGPTYQAFARKSLTALVLDSAEALAAVGALLAYGLVRPSLHWRRGGDVLAVAMMGFLLSVVLQAKGFSYHYYPVSGVTLVLAGVVLVTRQPRFGHPLERAGVLVLAVLLLTGTATSVGWSVSQLWRQDPVYARQQGMANYVRQHATDGSVLRLGYEDNFPMVDQAGARWSMRFPNLWFVQGTYAEQLGSPSVFQYRAPEAMKPAERWCFEAVIQDVIQRRPSLLMIVRPHPPGVAGRVTRLDYLKYFSQDRRFVAALGSYDYIGDVAGYAAFHRQSTRLRTN
jgi:hypothetical protein